MPKLVFSLENEITRSTVLIGTSQASSPAWPDVNFRSPEYPYEPWRSTLLASVGDYVAINRGSVLPIGFLGISRTNLQSVTIRTSAAGSPPYNVNVALSTALDPLTGRYNLGYVFPGGISCGYIEILMGPQTTLAEGLAPAEPRPFIGGIWYGTIVQPPMNPGADLEWSTIAPRLSVAPDSRAMMGVNTRTGYLRSRVRMTLRAESDWRRPWVTKGLTYTQLSLYLQFIRQLQEVGTFAFFENTLDVSRYAVMQLGDEDPTWSLARLKRASSALVLEELV